MAIRYIDQHGIAHRGIPQTIGVVYAWCYVTFKSIHLMPMEASDDAPEATCLWCAGDRERKR
jgi:hypothetical protein